MLDLQRWQQGDPSQLANVDYHYVVDGASMTLAECADVADYYIDVLKLPVFAWPVLSTTPLLHFRFSVLVLTRGH